MKFSYTGLYYEQNGSYYKEFYNGLYYDENDTTLGYMSRMIPLNCLLLGYIMAIDTMLIQRPY
jgi:hypothetical protein